MKKLAIAVLLGLSACHRPAAGGAATGAATAREALDRFLATAKAQDYDGMAAVWGSSKGPSSVTRARTEREQRQFVMMKCLRHDAYQVKTESPSPSGERVFAVELRLRDVAASSNFTAVPGPGGRWYLQGFSPEDLQSICTSL